MRYHYHNLAFIGDTGKIRSGVAQLATRQVPAPAIISMRQTLEFDENAVLISTSHLGYMTEEEYKSGHITPPSRLQMTFWAVLIVALLIGLYFLLTS